MSLDAHWRGQRVAGSVGLSFCNEEENRSTEALSECILTSAFTNLLLIITNDEPISMNIVSILHRHVAALVWNVDLQSMN